MFLPDRALKDDTRLRFLTPHPPMPEGLSVVPVDLAAFFVLVDRLGRNEALLLLTVKALRQRTGLLALRTNDLAWMLRSTNRRVMRWLDRLVRHRTIVYHVEDLWGVDTVMVEVIVPAFETAPTTAGDYHGAKHHELPTHWFVQVLPRVGRTTFVVYLCLLAHETREDEHAGFRLTDIVGRAKLSNSLHARFHLWRLRRHALIAPHPRGRGFVLTDPPPPTGLQRLILRYRALPFLRRALFHLALLLLLLGGLIAALLIFSHHSI
jgi:hypothetical protein